LLKQIKNNMKLTDEFIKQRFDSITDRDGYGQRRIFDQRINAILPEFSEDEIKDFCRTSKNWAVGLYGGRVGTYYAIVKR